MKNENVKAQPKFNFGEQIIEKRFGSIENLRSQTEINYRTKNTEKTSKKHKKEQKLNLNKNLKCNVNKESITEYTVADKLSELLCINNKKIANTKLKNEELECDTKEFEDYNMSWSIPPRVPYDGSDKVEYKKKENTVFNEWKRKNYNFIFERNIEIWRQFWITCERSDVIIQIIDARNPAFFINRDVIQMYPTKEHVIFANKADLTDIKINDEKYNVIYYSATSDVTNVINYINKCPKRIIGFIGYPNVGKSSTINAILNKKQVKVSQTPGKTKFIQSIVYDDKILLDCPGLVFPKHTKANLLMNGILNVDKVMDLKSSLYDVIDFIGLHELEKYYNFAYTSPHFVTCKEFDFINKLADYKGWSVSQTIKNIIKDLFMGKLQYKKIEESYSNGKHMDFYT